MIKQNAMIEIGDDTVGVYEAVKSIFPSSAILHVISFSFSPLVFLARPLST